MRTQVFSPTYPTWALVGGTLRPAGETIRYMLAGCFSYWCGCCQIYNTAEDLGESGMLYLLLSCITPCVPIMMMRGKAREQFDIQGQTFALLVRKVNNISTGS